MAIKTTTSHVNTFNNLDIVYVKGNEFLEGSIRFKPTDDAITTHHTEIQVRVEGIWRDAGLRLSTQSLLLGLNVDLEAHGNLIHIDSVQPATHELLVGAEFDDSGSKPAKVAILGTRLNRLVIRSVESDETITTSDAFAFTPTFNSFQYVFYFKTGSVAATSSVTLTIQKGAVGEGGDIFFKKEMPSSDWTADTEVIVEIDGALNSSIGNEFTSTISSDNNFSLKGEDFGGGDFRRWFALDTQLLDSQALMSTPNGTDRFLISSSGSFIGDNSGNMVLKGEQVIVG